MPKEQENNIITSLKQAGKPADAHSPANKPPTPEMGAAVGTIGVVSTFTAAGIGTAPVTVIPEKSEPPLELAEETEVAFKFFCVF